MIRLVGTNSLPLAPDSMTFSYTGKRVQELNFFDLGQSQKFQKLDSSHDCKSCPVIVGSTELMLNNPPRATVGSSISAPR